MVNGTGQDWRLNMKQFEIGKYYEAQDTAVPPIKVLKRTDKMITVTNDCTTWRMKIWLDSDGNECVTDSAVPVSWRECYTYKANYLTECQEDY